MPDDKIGTLEKRTRVICHLPANIHDNNEFLAVDRVLTYLQKQREKAPWITGFTCSSSRPTTYHGYWWDTNTIQWIRDDIVICVIDYTVAFDDIKLVEHLSKLRNVIFKTYEEKECPQDEIWLIVQPVYRLG